jgi:NhaC family Na+:H+ antiporter
VIILAIILILGLAYLKLSTLTVFLLAIIATAIIALVKNFSLNEIQEFILEGCKKSMLVVLILMAVGTVVGSWIVSGVVPSIIYYGLKLLLPSIFLPAGFIICCVVSFFTGSSYTSIATLGVAFMGIGFGMEINPGITAGMILSGSIFGDKMSPFSDTTNLAPGVAGTDIFEHIRSMLYTTVPSLVISLILYAIIGMKYSTIAIDYTNVEMIQNSILENFAISPILLLIPLITIVLAIKKVPPFIALLIGAIAGVIAAIIFQDFGIKVILNSLASGFKIDSGIYEVDKLLNRGGVSGMMGTVSLAILALGFGEMLQKMGVLKTLLEKIQTVTQSPRRLVITTLFTCLLTNMLTASQYMAIILPGEVFKDSYKKCGVKASVLSRTLEDGGTIFSFLVPWSMAAVYASGVLGVSTLQYLPYSFLAILCPVFAIIYALTDKAIFRIEETEE